MSVEKNPVKCIGERIIAETTVIFQLDDKPTLEELELFVTEAYAQGMRSEDKINVIPPGPPGTKFTTPYALSVSAGDWAYSFDLQEGQR